MGRMLGIFTLFTFCVVTRSVWYIYIVTGEILGANQCDQLCAVNWAVFRTIFRCDQAPHIASNVFSVCMQYNILFLTAFWLLLTFVVLMEFYVVRRMKWMTGRRQRQPSIMIKCVRRWNLIRLFTLISSNVALHFRESGVIVDNERMYGMCACNWTHCTHENSKRHNTHNI